MKKITKEQERKVAELYSCDFSAPEIAKKLNLSLNQIYRSLKRQKIPRRNPTVQNAIRFRKQPLSYRFKERLSLKEKELLISAAMLYYGEGAKTNTTVDLANSDTEVLKIFIKFLREICRVDENRLRFYLYCFRDQDAEKLINYWCSQLKVKRTQFTKPYIRRVKRDDTRVMPHGVLHIRYSDKRLLEHILSLYKTISKEIIES